MNDSIFYQYVLSLLNDAGLMVGFSPVYANHSINEIVNSHAGLSNCSGQLTNSSNALLSIDNISLIMHKKWKCAYNRHTNSVKILSATIDPSAHLDNQDITSANELLSRYLSSSHSIILLKQDEEFVFSFRYNDSLGSISNWFSMVEDYSQLVEMLNISNISIDSCCDYFCDFQYSVVGKRYPVYKELETTELDLEQDEYMCSSSPVVRPLPDCFGSEQEHNRTCGNCMKYISTSYNKELLTTLDEIDEIYAPYIDDKLLAAYFKYNKKQFSISKKTGINMEEETTVMETSSDVTINELDDIQKEFVALGKRYPDSFQTRSSLKSLLMNNMPNQKRSNIVLLNAYEEGIITALSKSQDKTLAVLNVIKALQDYYCMSRIDAVWAIKTYCYLLNDFEIANALDGISPKDLTLGESTKIYGNEELRLESGIFKAGKDIPYGLISLSINKRSSYEFFYYVSTDPSFKSCITRGSFKTKTYIRINSGDYLKLSTYGNKVVAIVRKEED